MATNDLVLLDQLLDQRLSEIGQGLTEEEFFEVFCAEQALKDDDLSYEELASGITDGGGDGGIDSVYFFVNNCLYSEEMDMASYKKGVTLRLALTQSKTTPGFSDSAIDKMISSARDLFDLNTDLAKFDTVYNEKLIAKITEFRNTCLALTSKFPEVKFEYVYATKGCEVHPNVERKVKALDQTIHNFFGSSTFDFRFLTAADLLAHARRMPSTTSNLRLAENPISTGQEGFLCLVNLRDYLAFITGPDGNLLSHLFEGNVRDYQGRTEVNLEIRRTLETADGEDFWWLNNGISVICSKASSSGKVLTIKDAEIVNGLQSSREIYSTLHGKDLSKETRNLLVRVLKPEDEASRDRIIKATNSQTPIPAASLRATDKIHRDIEQYLNSEEYYYDRRKNYYKNIGKPIRRIFGIPFVAQSVMACALADPSNARARPSSLLKRDQDYERIFNPKHPIGVYLKCPLIVRRVEEILKQSGSEEYCKHVYNLVFYVASLWALRYSGGASPNLQIIADLNVSEITADSVMSAAEDVWLEYVKLGQSDKVAKGPDLKQALVRHHRDKIAAKKERGSK